MKAGIDYIGVGVGTFLLNGNNEILLLKRNFAPEKDYWCCPGGRIEWMETAAEAAIREIREETNLMVKHVEFLAYVNHIVPHENKHWISINFITEAFAGTVKNVDAKSHSDIRWFDIYNLPEKLSLSNKNICCLVEKYIAKKERLR